MRIEFTTIEKVKRFKGEIDFKFDGDFVYIWNRYNSLDAEVIGSIQTISNHRDSKKLEIFTDNGNICINKK